MKCRRTVLTAGLLILGLVAATAFAQDGLPILMGTDGDDVIAGTPASESIYARAGNDVINAGAGDDELDGGMGADAYNGGAGSDSVAYSGTASVVVTLDGIANDGAAGEGDNVATDVEDIFGADGPDKLTGSATANTIDGGAGDDKLTGGGGKDRLFGGDGDDVIDSRDGVVDHVDCGPGSDTATIDRNDIVSLDCERRAKPPSTLTPALSIRGRERRFTINQILSGSKVVMACVRGCHPSSPPSKPIFRRSSVRLNGNQLFRAELPARISGATIELGVSGPGASDTKCVRYKVGAGFRSLRTMATHCTTVARSLRP